MQDEGGTTWEPQPSHRLPAFCGSSMHPCERWTFREPFFSSHGFPPTLYTLFPGPEAGPHPTPLPPPTFHVVSTHRLATHALPAFCPRQPTPTQPQPQASGLNFNLLADCLPLRDPAKDVEHLGFSAHVLQGIMMPQNRWWRQEQLGTLVDLLLSPQGPHQLRIGRRPSSSAVLHRSFHHSNFCEVELASK